MDSHYVPVFTERRRDGTQLAVCGQWVMAPEHSTEPTCGECHEWLMEDAEQLEQLKRWSVLQDAKR